MKKNIAKSVVLVSALAAAGMGATVAQAAEFGRVISSTPVVEHISVPRQVCTTTQVQSQTRSGGGALIGALVGGAVGNQFGGGNGRAVSTLIGAVGGSLVGDQIEAQNYGSYPVTQNVQQCRTENTVESRTVAFNVLYEYAGQRYTVQMPHQPGNRIALQVSAAGSNFYAQPMGVQVIAQPVVQPVYYAPPVQTVTYQPGYVRPAVAVIAPVYAPQPRPYYGENHWQHRDRDWR
jgi:uncharacterized protein YcfJ